MMLFEFIIIAVLVVAAMVAYSEYTKHPYVGVIAGVILIIMGLLLLTDMTGIQVKTGETITYSGLGLLMGVKCER